MQDLTQNFSPLGGLSPSVTLSLAARAKEMKAIGKNVYSMSVGEPDFDTPQTIKDACIDAINKGMTAILPHRDCLLLKQKL